MNSSAVTTDGRYHIKVDDEANFTTRRLCPFHHNYHLHPLLQLGRLEELAHELAKLNRCRFMAPGTTVTSPFNHKGTSPDGRSIADVFARMEEPGSWIALYNIEGDATYKNFLWEVIASAEHLLKREEKVFEMRGFIFVSSPPSATPFHIDRENNFWMMIRGQKTMTLWDRNDRDTVAAPDVEQLILNRSLDNVKLTEAKRARGREFVCGPGDGLFWPSTTPHMAISERDWVTPGNGISISIGIDFYTDVTRRNAYVHTANTVLRRFGLRPRSPEHSPWDPLKYAAGRMTVGLLRVVRGFVPPPGF